jgi:hypothetical protein
MLTSELPVVMLTASQKAFVKSELLKVTSCLEHWQETYNQTFSPEKPISISGIKKKILDSSLEETFPQIVQAKALLNSFINNHVNSLGAPLEYTVICSFSAMCISLARSRSQKVSADLNVDPQSVYEDILQDAYASVHHAMYYFTQGNIQLSTFVLNAVKRSIERCSHYKYSKLSPMSPDDIRDVYKCRTAMGEDPGMTVEELAQEVGLTPDRAEEVLSYMTKVVRSSQSTSSNDSFDVVSNIPQDSSSLEEVDNIDTVDFLKKIFDQTDHTMLSLSKEEKEVIAAAVFYRFERGWQSTFAKQYINQSTGKPYTRARIGQFFSSALTKIKAHLEAA